MESRIVMVNSYAHRGLTGMALKDNGGWEEAQISRVTDHPKLGRCFVATEVEKAMLLERRYGGVRGNFSLAAEEFADEAFLLAVPFVPQERL